jgi:adenine-specific DNA-methyltransferase
MASGTKAPKSAKSAKSKPAKTYRHPESESLMRPEVGTQAQFKKKLPPQKYRYDDSLSPALEWDGQNSARERGEALIRQILEAETLEKAKGAAANLKAMSKPFLNWAGKAERLSFEVPTLPLFIHERLSTKVILETLKGHKRDKQTDMFDLWGDPQHSITDQVLRAYEHKDKWVNRMILGDSLVVMNSLLRYENLGGQVQMIYIDPPYGVSFGSNFQPFVRRRDVGHNDDENMTREPEMVQAYRDTWELGLHSYLSYLRDRIVLARDLLSPAGSIFVQIGGENLHHVRELMEDVFGAENAYAIISVKKTSGLSQKLLPSTQDFLLWYVQDRDRAFFQKVYTDKIEAAEVDAHYTRDEDGRLVRLSDLTGPFSDTASCMYDVVFEGARFRPSPGRQWKTTLSGMHRLAEAGRIVRSGDMIYYKRFADDFPVSLITDTWHDISGSVQSRKDRKIYVVQTGVPIIERCIQMTTRPGDLVLDPTCGSGTTAYCSEKWGRRWVTIDTSRVPLALARQRLLTATYDWFGLKDESRGPVGGFEYKQRQNNKGDQVGGIIPQITLESIAKNEPPTPQVLVDRPETQNGITRVTGPFCVEATIPTAEEFDEIKSDIATAPQEETRTSFVDRMLEILRKSPLLRLEGNKTVTLKNVRPPAKTLSLSAEAMVPNGTEKPVAFVFGPENGAVSEKLVYQAAKEANAKSYAHLYVIGFAIQPNARMLVEQCADVVGIPATYVQATPDLMMGDLLKNMRSSQIFSVCGLPEAEIRKAKKSNGSQFYEAELLGLDVFDPVAMEVHHRKADDVPAWFLDTDYNGLCFHVSQAFFPRTSAWENLKKALKGEYEDTVWDHLAGTVSAPFEAGEQGQIAIKVIDDRGNELLIVKSLSEPKR